MATSFPSSLDSFTNPSASDALDSVSVPHADQHANLNDAMEAVQAKLGVGAGTIGEGTSFTASWTNLTPGNATESWRYWQVNKIVVVQGYIEFGSTTSITASNPMVDLPVPLARANANSGITRFNEDGVGQVYGIYELISGDRVRFRATFINGSIIRPASLNATTPFTWGTGDELSFTLTYGAA